MGRPGADGERPGDDDLVGPADAARTLTADKQLRALGQALSQLHARVPVDLAAPT